MLRSRISYFLQLRKETSKLTETLKISLNRSLYRINAQGRYFRALSVQQQFKSSLGGIKVRGSNIVSMWNAKALSLSPSTSRVIKSLSRRTGSSKNAVRWMMQLLLKMRNRTLDFYAKTVPCVRIIMKNAHDLIPILRCL